MSLRLVKTKKNIRLFVLSLATSSVLFLAACSGDGRPLEEAVEAEKLGLNSISIVQPSGLLQDLYVNTGEQVKFSVTAKNTAGADVALSSDNRRWLVRNPPSNVAAAVGKASIDENGNFTAIAVGIVEVYLQIGHLDASFPLTISDGVLTSINSIDGPDTLERCIPGSFSATGNYSDGSTRGLLDVNWALDDMEMTSLPTNSDGSVDVVGFNTGEFNLIATSVDGVGERLLEPVNVSNNLLSIDITPAELAVEKGSRLSLIATGMYERIVNEETVNQGVVITDNVAWSMPADNGFATVSNTQPNVGRATGVSVGATTIDAACGDMFATQRPFTVIAESDTALAFEDGTEQTISLSSAPSKQLRVSTTTGTDFEEDNEKTSSATWSVKSGSSVVAFDSPNKGFITAKLVGEATVEVEYNDSTELLFITVIP